MLRPCLVVATILSAAVSVAADCRPKTCFYWISDCVTKEGLTADIAAMADAGIGEAYICSANMMRRPPSVGAQLLSPQGLDLFAHAVQEAKRRGLKFGFHNCPGWSESGGPWIRPEDSMKCVVSSMKDVPPGRAAGKLPQPRTNLGFYRDLATVAFPVEPTPTVTAVTCDWGGDVQPFVKGEKPLTLPLAKEPAAPATLTYRFARPFRPSAAIFRFVDSNVNCEGVVEGSADGTRWIKLADFCYHFHFVPSRTEKILTLNAAGAIDRLRVTFRANAVPEWQGGRPVDRQLDSVAFTCAPMIAEADLKSSASTAFAYVPPHDPSSKGIAKADWLTVPAKPQADGTLDWLAPARTDGKVWRIVRLGYTTTGKRCAPATLPGLECDKLSRRGLDAHWPNMPGKLLAVPGAKDVLTSFYIDSWEAGGQNWTEGFAEEFLRRRGYDLAPYLPVFAGVVVDDAGTTAKALYDIQLTVADLIAENYFGHYNELCRRAGVKASTEAYGGAYDSLRCAGLADLPCGELWIGGKDERTLKMASSAAHVHGRPTVESETFTTDFAEGRWQVTPHELKVWGDVAWLNGVNGIIYHSYAHQPLKAKPGLSLGRHGTQLNRNTTWWPEMRHWTDYVRRGQELLRAGSPVADLLVVVDEGNPNDWPEPRSAVAAGYHYDLVSAFDFRRMEKRGRGLGLEGGATYPVAFLAGRHYTAATLRKVADLAAAGVKIAGARPLDTPTLSDDGAAWCALRDRLWGGAVLAEADPRKALERCGVKPSVRSSPQLDSLRRELPDGTKVFFVVNRTGQPFRAPVDFAAEGTGEVRNLIDGTGVAYHGALDLPPNGSAFVVFKPGAKPPEPNPEPTDWTDVSEGWTITSFAGVQPPSAPLKLARLIDWSHSADPKLRHFAGRAVYETTIRPTEAYESLTLDLGEVRDLANVSINGEFVACLWEPPYRVRLPKKFCTTTPLDLKIEVVNTWPNRLIGDAILRANGAKEPCGEAGWPQWVLANRESSGTGLSTWSNFNWAWKATDALRPAGLLGPVRLGGENLSFACAKPVWPVGRATRMNDTVRFIGEFTAEATEAVVLKLTGSTCYRVRLNGEFLAFGPVRGPRGMFRVDPIPLKGKLATGTNRLEIDAYGGNVNNFMYMNAPSFLQAEVVSGDRVRLATGTNGGFVALDPHERIWKVPRFDYQRLFSEAYRIGKTDRSERLTLEERPAVRLLPRRVPFPEYAIDRSFAKVETIRRRYDPTCKVRVGRENVSSASEGRRGFDRREFELDVKSEIQRYLPAADGDIVGTVWRGRKIAAGFVGVEVTCRKPGRLVVYQSELPNRAFNGQENDGGYATFYEIADPGEYVLESFVPNGMMYVETFMHGGEAEVKAVWVREYKNPLPGRFRYSGTDPDIATICTAAAETLAINSADLFTDCPGRERAAWIGDTYFTGKASSFLIGSTFLEDVFLENFALAEKFEGLPEGAIPMLYPGNPRKDHFIPNFCMWFGMQIADYAKRGGDPKIVAMLKPKLYAFIRYIERFRNADGLLENLPSWVFIEWSKTSQFVTGVNYPSNMQYAGMLDALAELYGDATLAERAAVLKRKIRERSWNGTWFRDCNASEEGTECCQYCAFFFGVADFQRDRELWERLVTQCGPLRDAKKVHPQLAPANSIFGYYMRFDMLLRTGRFDVLDRETRDYFLKMAKTTGTIWENQTATGSKCHGLSSIAAYFVTHGKN